MSWKTQCVQDKENLGNEVMGGRFATLTPFLLMHF
jgi:hypothetical protein